MRDFYSLEVVDVNNLTVDSVVITFKSLLEDKFDFIPGQYITIKHMINNQEVRRSYSISSCPGENIEIGVKLVPGGLMSTYLTKELKKGDSLDVMPPLGSFFLENKIDNKKHYVGICAGSGITPVLSMIRQTLKIEKDSDFTLIYGNKTRDSIMFFQELQLLEKDFQSQFFVHYVFSRDNVPDCIKGRLNRENLVTLFSENLNLLAADKFFLCGPGEMIDVCADLLAEKDVNSEKVYFERFTPSEIQTTVFPEKEELTSDVTVMVDGDEFQFSLSSNGESVLDAAMESGADVPYSCKGGVCCVCKAKVLEGNVQMDQNFSLSEDEINQGFVLTCQSHPASKVLKIDFDEM